MPPKPAKPRRRRTPARRRRTPAAAKPRRRPPSSKPEVGEVRFHPKLCLLYILYFLPGSEHPAWVRFDAWRAGKLRTAPHRTAAGEDLRRIDPPFFYWD